jgi:hypothetical protein
MGQWLAAETTGAQLVDAIIAKYVPDVSDKADDSPAWETAL